MGKPGGKVAGTRVGSAATYWDMRCVDCREALSAGLDGEQEPGEQAVVDAHLAGCPECRAWQHAAAEVTRLARLSLVGGPGPVEGRPLDARRVATAAPGSWRGRLAVALRVGLAALGVAQVLLALAQMAAPMVDGSGPAGHMQGATAVHLIHESAAWNVAVGVAFLVVALRRARPAGLVPVLTAFVAVLCLLCVDDAVAGMVTVARLASHLLVLVGYVVVLLLDLPSLRRADPPGTRLSRRWPRLRAELPTEDDNVITLPLPSRGNAATDGRRSA